MVVYTTLQAGYRITQEESKLYYLSAVSMDQMATIASMVGVQSLLEYSEDLKLELFQSKIL